jgi:plastocyanin
MTTKLTTAIALGLASLALAACGASSSSSSSSSASAASGHVTVAISNFKYAPAKLTVKPGTSVTFSNHDMTAHTATANAGFDSGTIKPGASATVKFSKPGTYPYICQFHAFMHGTVVVS